MVMELCKPRVPRRQSSRMVHWRLGRVPSDRAWPRASTCREGGGDTGKVGNDELITAWQASLDHTGNLCSIITSLPTSYFYIHSSTVVCQMIITTAIAFVFSLSLPCSLPGALPHPFLGNIIAFLL